MNEALSRFATRDAVDSRLDDLDAKVAEWRDQNKMEVTGQKTLGMMLTVLADGGMPKLTSRAVPYPGVRCA